MIDIPNHLLDNRRPFFVCSKSVLEQQAGKIRELGAEVFYSVKTNPEQKILQELHRLGVGFSVSNQDEFLSVMSVGADPEHIIYYERGLTGEKIKWLSKNGCRCFVVENKRAFESLAPGLSSEYTVMARLRAEPAASKYSGSYAPGLSLGDAKIILSACKKAGSKTGFLHHSSSQVEDPACWRKKFEFMSRLPEADVIDIGGGVPVGYNGEDYSAVLDEIKAGIKKLNAGRVIAEPGRFIVGPACSLVTRAEVVDGRDVILNASVYNVHIDTIIAGLILPCRSLKERAHGKTSGNFRLLGSSLCNLDVFDDSAKLPAVDEGDPIVFDNAGAYNFSSEFSSGKAVETYMVQ